MTWHKLYLNDDYEISDEFPYDIRQLSRRRMVKEFNDGKYQCVRINRRKYLKHRIIAEQFIPKNDDEDLVIHINHDKTDNHIDNLKWECKPKHEDGYKVVSSFVFNYNDYADKLSVILSDDNLIPVKKYMNHLIQDGYWYDVLLDKFYYKDQELITGKYNKVNYVLVEEDETCSCVRLCTNKWLYDNRSVIEVKRKMLNQQSDLVLSD